MACLNGLTEASRLEASASLLTDNVRFELHGLAADEVSLRAHRLSPAAYHSTTVPYSCVTLTRRDIALHRSLSWGFHV
jgi:hypothetical protein